MHVPKKKWKEFLTGSGGVPSVPGEHRIEESEGGKDLVKASLPERTQQKSFKVIRDLILVFFFFALAFVLTSVLDLHSSFEAASLELKDSPFQYDELVVALAILAAALSVFAMRRWRELEVEIVERIEVEDALVESEERYRTLAEAAQDFIFILDRDGKIKYLNNYAADKLGSQPKEIIGDRQDVVFPEDMADQQKLALREVFKTGKPLNFESQADFDGQLTWQSTSMVPIKDDISGKFSGVLGISRDITGRKRAEDALQETTDGLEVIVARRTGELENLNERLQLELDEKKLAEERLQAVNRALRTSMAADHALFGASGEPELLHDICKAVVEVGGYRFVWVGFVESGAEKLVRPVASAGYEKGYLESAKVSWDEVSELGRGPTGNAIRSGKPSVVRDLQTDTGYLPWREEALTRGYASTVALPLSAGGESFGSLNIYASEPDAFDPEEVELLMGLAGNLSYGISALRTRGERDEQAVALRRTGEQLSLLLESLPIIFYTSRAEDDFGVTYVSSNVEIVTGHKPDDLISDSSFWIDHIHPEDAPRVFEELPKVFQKGYHEYEYRWRSADGSYKWFLDVLRLAQPEGAEVGYIIGMWLDITARKHSEESLMKAKDRLEDDAEKRLVELERATARFQEKSDELERVRRDERLTRELDEILQSCLTVEEACTALAQSAADIFPGASGALYLVDESSQIYKVSGSWGESPPVRKEFNADDCWSLRQGQNHIFIQGGHGMRCPHVSEETAVDYPELSADKKDDLTYMCIPVRATGSILGVMHILPKEGSQSDEKELEEMQQLAQILAGYVGMTVNNLRLREAG
ncbi:MAG: GAF domain-containing protein [Thermoleophilia bacterium]|jgi:PAS domain S-box-containing protein